MTAEPDRYEAAAVLLAGAAVDVLVVDGGRVLAAVQDDELGELQVAAFDGVWVCSCGVDRCVHLLAVQLVTPHLVKSGLVGAAGSRPARVGAVVDESPTRVRGADMSSRDYLAWVLRLLRVAAEATGVDVYDADCAAYRAVAAVLDELDDEGVRFVCEHLALAPRRLGAITFDLTALEVLTLLRADDGGAAAS